MTPTEHPEQQAARYIERDGNTTTVHTPYGKHSILYNLHWGRINPDQLPADTDGITLEMLSDFWTEHPITSLGHFSVDEMYSTTIMEARKKRIPVLLMSPYIRGRLTAKTKAIAEICECAVAGGIAAGLIRNRVNTRRTEEEVVQEKICSRRSFFANALKTSIAAWLATPIATTTARIGTTHLHKGGGISKRLRDGSNFLHPELEHFFPDSRIFAIIMAQKVVWLQKTHGMKHLVSIVGADHADLESATLQTEYERFIHLEEKRRIVGEAIDPDSLHTIIRMDATKDPETISWEQTDRYSVPLLREFTKYVRDGKNSFISPTPPPA